MRRWRWLVALALVACKSPAPSATTPPATTTPAPKPAHSGPMKAHAEGEASVTIAGSDAPAKETQASPKSAGLPAVDFGPAGPVEIKGYPTPLEIGRRDWATAIGWTKDGDDVLACGAMTPLGDSCFSRKRGATKTVRSSMDGSGQSPRPTAALSADLALVKTAVRSDLVEDLAKGERRPPPLKASWPYAKDLVVVVVDGAPLKVGGYVRGQEPVHPIMLNVKSKAPSVTYDGRWNAIVASPDESEIAFIGHFFCMEWCNEIVITRLTTGELASAIYNDTGFRLHQKKDYAGSRDLFLKAAWANPRAPLPPYNLACAYALLGDEANAEKALKLAIAVGGDEVKARAQKDADFAKVRAAAWFEKLVS